MQFVKFLVSLLFTTLLILLFDWHHPFDTPLPSVGRFFNPGSGFWQNMRVQDVPRAQELLLEGVTGDVEIIMDERLVPHIFADNLEDAAFAEGYLHAMHRLWQMDISVRQVAGRLSEVLGESTLESDRYNRRRGMVMAAQNTLIAWERQPAEIAIVNAYTDGVNAYIRTLKPRDYPIEFKLLGYAPEEWTPLKSALFFKNMVSMLVSRNNDLAATNAQSTFGKELFAFLYPEKNPQQSPVIPEGTPWNFKPLDLQVDTTDSPNVLGEVFHHDPLPQPPKYNGSNNWAVSGTKTASGHPILCDDPHLGLTLPAIWYEVQIHTPEVNTYGVSLPCLPGIVIGFNENISWGVTNVGHDELDWYRIIWTDTTKTRYLLDDQQMEVTIRPELIKVRGKEEPLVEQVKYTIWGPIVYESDDSPYQDMAMRWIAHDMPGEQPFYDIGAFIRIMESENYDEFSEAMLGYDMPPQNFAFASKDGDIALKVNGKFPLKKQGQGPFIQDGSVSRNTWKGFIPKEHVPQVRNPARGFVASANQRSTDETYPYYYNGGFDDYRGRYINRRLAEMDNITVEDMMALQLDNYSIKAEENVPILLALLNESELSESEKEMLQKLQAWDFHFDKELQAPVIFEEWFQEVYKQTFDEVYKVAQEDSIEVLFPEDWRLTEIMQTLPQHKIFDVKATKEVEKATEVVTNSFKVICSEIRETYGEDFTWSQYKEFEIAHIGRINAFNSKQLDVGGYGDAINSIKSKRSHGPSWRMIVEMSDEVQGWGVYPGGQSGHPASKFYDSMVQQWAAGKYNKLFFMKNPDDRSQPILQSFTIRNQQQITNNQ